MVSLNHLFNNAPRDGSALAVVDGVLVFQALFGSSAAKYDPRQFGWIGSRAKETPLCATWHTKGVATIQDAMNREVAVGAVSGARTSSTPRMLNALIGTKFKVVTGYPGGSEFALAMERGETDGICGWSWTTIKRRYAEWLRDKKIALLLQTGLEKAPDLPDVPFALDLVRSDDERKILRLLLGDTQLATPLLAPPKVPVATVAALRKAFDTAMSDELLLKEAQQLQVDIDPSPGAKLQESVERMFSLPPPLIARAKEIFQ
jgi:hypothetical protein